VAPFTDRQIPVPPSVSPGRYISGHLNLLTTCLFIHRYENDFVFSALAMLVGR